MEIKVLASGSKGNAYYVSDGTTPLLLECGIPFRDIQRALGFKVSDIAGCLISHAHHDHCRAVKDMLKAGVNCYMADATADALGIADHHRVLQTRIAMVPDKITIGTWSVLAFDAVHDVPSLGFLLSSRPHKLLYLSDSAYCPYRFRGLTHIMIGCNYDLALLNANIEAGTFEREGKARLMHSHASLETVKQMLRANDLSLVQAIWLLHLSDSNADAERFKREIQELCGKPTYIAY